MQLLAGGIAHFLETSESELKITVEAYLHTDDRYTAVSLGTTEISVRTWCIPEMIPDMTNLYYWGEMGLRKIAHGSLATHVVVKWIVDNITVVETTLRVKGDK